MITSRKPVYKGKIFTITHTRVVDENGVEHLIEKCNRPDVVTVIGITKDREIVMIKEFRPGGKKYVLWLPGGRLDKGENFREAGLREFEEETGFTASKLSLFHEKHRSDNFSGQGRVFLATGLNLLNCQRSGDEKSKIETVLIPTKKATKLALEGKIPNEFFGFLILKLNYLIELGQIKA